MSTEPIRTIFAGTPDFAIPSLNALITDDDLQMSAVITQPDKKVGRKQALTPPPVKQVARDNSIPVYQPENITEIKEELQQYQPDILVVVAYSRKIPEEILDLPRYGCFNLHASLLPHYRGAAAVQTPILNGDNKTGVTIIKMDTGLDTGDILAQKELELSGTETASFLHNRLSLLGADILPHTLKEYIEGDIEPQPQDESQASYVRVLKKEDGKIDRNESAKTIERKVRALKPWPGTYSYMNLPPNKSIKIKIQEVDPEILNVNEYPVGTLFLDREEDLGMQCGENALKITRIQPEGKNVMTAEEFIRGYKDLIGRPLE